MADITWPTSLPQRPINMLDTPDQNFLRSGMEVGPPKVRRRSTASRDTLQLTFQMGTDDLTTFETFYNDAALGGAVPFDYTHPRTGVTKAYTFMDSPNISPIGGTEYTVSFTLQAGL